MGFCVSVVDQNRPTTSPAARLNVSPSVSDNKALTKIDVEVPRSRQYHAGLGLSAVAFV
jgi:hypothetical protein